MIDVTWDGLPVAEEPPYGAAVFVWHDGAAERMWLLLHRAHHGPEYEGDWAWTPPSGARLPGESIDACAQRELLEETGVAGNPTPTASGTPDWSAYTLEVRADTPIELDDEHDRYEWVSLDEATHRCLPASVALMFIRASDALRAASGGTEVPHPGAEAHETRR
jgi:8-oxo-dGTP pyrophosphatase MutT (NUDIX family)